MPRAARPVAGLRDRQSRIAQRSVRYTYCHCLCQASVDARSLTVSLALQAGQPTSQRYDRTGRLASSEPSAVPQRKGRHICYVRLSAISMSLCRHVRPLANPRRRSSAPLASRVRSLSDRHAQASCRTTLINPFTALVISLPPCNSLGLLSNQVSYARLYCQPQNKPHQPLTPHLQQPALEESANQPPTHCGFNAAPL